MSSCSVSNPIGFARKSVLLDRGELCDSCQYTPHAVMFCFFCPMTYHKSTSGAISSRQRSAGCSRSWSGRTARRAEPRNTRPTTTPSSCGATTRAAASEARFMVLTIQSLSCERVFLLRDSPRSAVQCVSSRSEDGRPRSFCTSRFMECVLLSFPL